MAKPSLPQGRDDLSPGVGRHHESPGRSNAVLRTPAYYSALSLRACARLGARALARPPTPRVAETVIAGASRHWGRAATASCDVSRRSLRACARLGLPTLLAPGVCASLRERDRVGTPSDSANGGDSHRGRCAPLGTSGHRLVRPLAPVLERRCARPENRTSRSLSLGACARIGARALARPPTPRVAETVIAGAARHWGRAATASCDRSRRSLFLVAPGVCASWSARVGTPSDSASGGDSHRGRFAPLGTSGHRLVRRLAPVLEGRCAPPENRTSRSLSLRACARLGARALARPPTPRVAETVIAGASRHWGRAATASCDVSRRSSRGAARRRRTEHLDPCRSGRVRVLERARWHALRLREWRRQSSRALRATGTSGHRLVRPLAPVPLLGRSGRVRVLERARWHALRLRERRRQSSRALRATGDERPPPRATSRAGPRGALRAAGEPNISIPVAPGVCASWSARVGPPANYFTFSTCFLSSLRALPMMRPAARRFSSPGSGMLMSTARS